MHQAPWRKYRIEIHYELIRTIPIHSDICIRDNANHSEPIQETFCILFDEKRSKINPTSSDSFRYLYPMQCELFRTNPRNFLYLVWWKTVKNQSDFIRLIPRHQSEWIRTNPKRSFQSRSIRINPSLDWSKPNYQSESIRIIPTLDWFGVIWIENLVSD